LRSYVLLVQRERAIVKAVYEAATEQIICRNTCQELGDAEGRRLHWLRQTGASEKREIGRSKLGRMGSEENDL
jgi:hypothetical protein